MATLMYNRHDKDEDFTDEILDAYTKKDYSKAFSKGLLICGVSLLCIAVLALLVDYLVLPHFTEFRTSRYLMELLVGGVK